MDPTSLDVRYWGQGGNPQPRHHGCVRLTDKHLAQCCIALMNEIIGWSGACATYSKQMTSPISDGHERRGSAFRQGGPLMMSTLEERR
jgi:hypothetical protein